MFILLSLLAAFIATVVNFSDKAIVSKYILDYRAASIFSAIIGAVIAVLVLPFGHWGTLTSTDILLVISSGVMLYLSYYTYWRAMSLARSTVVVMLIQLAPVLTLILSAIFLQEYLIPLPHQIDLTM